MPMPLSSSHIPPSSPLVIGQVQLQAGVPPIIAKEPHTLTMLVDSVWEAASNRAALEKLAGAILEQEQAPNGMQLAAILRPSIPQAPAKDAPGDSLPPDGPSRPAAPRAAPAGQVSEKAIVRMERLWLQNVNFDVVTAHQIDQSHARLLSGAPVTNPATDLYVNRIATSRVNISPRPSRPLLEFAHIYLAVHPDETPQAFFLPFRQLAERGIDIPDLAGAFNRGVLPYETFRDLVATYVSTLPPRSGESFTCNVWNSYTYWEQGLGAICSPGAMALLDGGAMTPETLLEWAGLKACVQRLPSDRMAKAGHAEEPFDFAKAIHARPATLLLADWTAFNSHHESARNLALIKDPARVLALADSLVPFEHIDFLVSIADKVDWAVLANEMDRVAAQYAPVAEAMRSTMQRNRGLSDKEAQQAFALHRAMFYNARTRSMHMEDKPRLQQSRSNMAPHLLRHQLLSEGRLDTWGLARGDGAGMDAGLHFHRLPAAALFDDWTARGIPADRQAWIGQLRVQGFDPVYAENVVRDHAHAPGRLQAWFAHGFDADLGHRLDKPMTEAVARWLADPAIPSEGLELAPRMIQSDLGPERIDNILRVPVYLIRAAAVFGPNATTPWQVWCGLTTPDELYERIVAGDESENQLREAAEQKQQELSELRRKTAETRERLRAMLHAMESLRADMAPDSPGARRCQDFAQAWRVAIDHLDGLLQPSLEARAADEAGQIAADLALLSAQLSFQITDLDDAPRGHAAMLAAGRNAAHPGVSA